MLLYEPIFQLSFWIHGQHPLGHNLDITEQTVPAPLLSVSGKCCLCFSPTATRGKVNQELRGDLKQFLSQFSLLQSIPLFKQVQDVLLKKVFLCWFCIPTCLRRGSWYVLVTWYYHIASCFPINLHQDLKAPLAPTCEMTKIFDCQDIQLPPEIFKSLIAACFLPDMSALKS